MATPKSKIILMVMLAALAVMAWNAVPVLADGQSGTTLSASKTATGFNEKVITYDWDITKTASIEEQEISSVEVPKGECVTINYLINVTRTQVGEEEKIGVRGEICVTNGGAVATENLKLVDQVEYKVGAGQFQPLPGATQIIIPSEQLGPGESECYPYEIEFTPVEGAVYRNTVKVTITNHSGHLGEEFGPEPKADFSIPSEQTVVEVDATASVEDAITSTCPDFTFTPSDSGPWSFSDSGSQGYSVEVCHISDDCDATCTLENTATLTESDSEETRTDSAEVSLSVRCPEGFEEGDYCTYTQGGWGATPSGGNPGQLLASNFDSVYPGGEVEVGIIGVGGHSMKFTSAAAIEAYLPAGGSPSKLTADLTNPTSSPAGVFGGQVLALQLNVDFSKAGVKPAGLADLTLCNFTTADTLKGIALTQAQVDALNGKTVQQVLDAANTALGGGAVGFGLSLSQLNDLVDLLNKAFDNCVPTQWAQDHLCENGA